MRVVDGSQEIQGHGRLSTRGLETLIAVLALLWLPFAVVYVVPTAGASVGAKGTSAQSSGSGAPYQVTLVEVRSNTWNSSAPLQPKVFVLGPRGLESYADIVLPAHTLIQLSIVSYDAPPPNSTQSMASVTGTVGGSVFVVNGTPGSGMSNGAMDAMVNWGKNETSVPINSLTGTITVPQIGLNIPFPSMSTTIAYIEFNQTGTFTWVRLPPCGLGSDGLSGAMNTPGWMMGSITVR